MGSKVSKAQRQLDELKQERQGLQDALGTIEAQQAEKRQELEGLYAVAERQPSSANTKAADRAEQEARDLENQLARKRAALAACEADIEQARQALQQAQHGEAVARLDAIQREAEKLAQRIDENALDAQAWGQLRQLYGESKRLLAGLNGSNTYRDLFEDPAAARGPVFEALVRQVDHAMGIAPKRGEVPAVADILRMGMARARVKKLS